MKTFQSFNDLDIPVLIKESLREMNFVTPTPIQASAIPAGLSGRDVVGTAQTGTGKTGAFGIPCLASLCAKPRGQALILAPTRELASQIYQVLRAMGKRTAMTGCLIIGGESFRRQANELSGRFNYIVATPGRLNDHLRESTTELSQVNVLVLDEVDRMLDMGFLPQVTEVLRRIPKQRQTMLFSATLPRDVLRFIAPLVRQPIRIEVKESDEPALQIQENIIPVRPEEKAKCLLNLLSHDDGKVLVFVRTKSRTHRLIRSLGDAGHSVVCLHGGRSQGQRKQALERFRSGSHRVMVATDLAGRGLDIIDIDHVINFDIPQTREDYIHRIGRTGRAGNRGRATSFVVLGDRAEELFFHTRFPHVKEHIELQTNFRRGSQIRRLSSSRHHDTQGVGDRGKNRDFRGRPHQRDRYRGLAGSNSYGNNREASIR